MDEQFQLFDTTLRDGAQREGISFSVEDKLAISRLLDEYGVGFIEGGWPGAMPRTPSSSPGQPPNSNCATQPWSRSVPPARPASRSPTMRRWPLLASQAPVITLVAKSDIPTSTRRCGPTARRTSPWSRTPWST